MFKPIADLPKGAVGFEAHGRVTDADRTRIFEPTMEWALERAAKVRLLYVAAGDFDGYERGDAYDDGVFGTRHFTDFDRIAFVADDGPYARSVAALDGLMPASVKVFGPAEVDTAKAWLAA
ncbi:MAG TPA: STAS/SEC14 domain-containing protein [Hyphomonadaceae bacterium]|nr:STAS/SEC14 domain-containing protein [Hyphomonadaceae bacterium]HVZ13009.1 STAS/SEC14 domain-containing protein [Bauldia sp.]